MAPAVISGILCLVFIWYLLLILLCLSLIV